MSVYVSLCVKIITHQMPIIHLGSVMVYYEAAYMLTKQVTRVNEIGSFHCLSSVGGLSTTSGPPGSHSFARTNSPIPNVHICHVAPLC